MEIRRKINRQSLKKGTKMSEAENKKENCLLTY